jgi:hypothetical protein
LIQDMMHLSIPSLKYQTKVEIDQNGYITSQRGCLEYISVTRSSTGQYEIELDIFNKPYITLYADSHKLCKFNYVKPKTIKINTFNIKGILQDTNFICQMHEYIKFDKMVLF